MTDVFEHMNELNIKMHELSENILTCSNKLHGFEQKLQLLQNELRLRSLEMLPRSYKNQEKVEKGFVLNLVKEYLHQYSKEMTCTFSQLTLKNMTKLEILSQLMLKCQRKNCPRVFEKEFL